MIFDLVSIPKKYVKTIYITPRIMDDVAENASGVATVILVDKALELRNNEIKYINFIAQTLPSTILTLKSGCESEIAEADAYYLLYWHLVKKKVIKSKIGLTSVFTWDNIYTIDKNQIKTENLKKLLDENDKDFPDFLKCYSIDHKELQTFLENYKNSPSDELNFMKGNPKKNSKGNPKKKSKEKTKSKVKGGQAKRRNKSAKKYNK
jgi:hypothetical protein